MAKGFKVHGIKATVTDSIKQQADIHVVSGPWFAKNYWVGHSSVILIDVNYYKGKNHVSAGWMDIDGERTFRAGCGRKPPSIKAGINGEGHIFLGDFNGRLHNADAIRLHPAREKPRERLVDVLRRFRLASGYRTTALITAALMGLEIKCLYENHILTNPNWLELLPWVDWSQETIESGELWDHLREL